jgi:flagellar basal-body rod protein FlgB
MSLSDLPMLGMLKTRMRWLETRQKVLAENVANSETPGYRQRDLKALRFSELMAGGAAGAVTPVRTSPMHITAGSPDDARFDARGDKSFETTPDGNSVVLEDEMLKVAETQQDFQLATMLYSKSLGLLKMAVKRG